MTKKIPMSLRFFLYKLSRKIKRLLKPYLHKPSGPYNAHINAGDPVQLGKMFLEYFTSVGKLKKSDSVLDVGSGYGRMAFPLTSYLDKNGRYEGIEIITEGVNYSKKEISSKFKNFHFQKIDVRNDLYNPNGKVEASEFKFPFKDNSFDFVFLTSVFTHMMRSEMENYTSEIARVLKNNGRFFITFFLLNEENENLIKEGKSKYTFKFQNDGCKIEFEDIPGRVVAFKEKEVRTLLKENNLKIDEI